MNPELIVTRAGAWWRNLVLFWVWLGTSGAFAGAAAENKVDELLNQAQQTHLQEKPQEAIALATQAVEAEPKNPQCYYVRGRLYDANRQYEKALADFSEALKLEPRAMEVYQHRGVVQFKLGRFAESIADFDKYLEKVPKQSPHHWQRGISCYYAGRYEDGRKQFESHQTVNANDVENAVWHYLCVARLVGVDKARASLIKIKDDRRVPMMQVYALFGGQGTVDDVLTAARAGDPPAAELNQRLFYAHLYAGLYFEAGGNEKLAREHILRAAETYRVNHYMGDVARVHADVFRKGTKQKSLPTK